MAIEVVDAPESDRYEARRSGEMVGFIQYRARPDTLVLLHTEVLPRFEGQGIGSTLIKTVLDEVRARGGTIAPVCPFVAAYIRRHPDYLDAVSPRYRDSFAAGTDVTEDDA